MSDLAARIRARLKALDISEREASRRSGFSVGYVGDVLSGRSKEPAMPRMIKLAQALECDVEYLIGHQGAARGSAGELRTFGDAPKIPASSQRLIDLYSSTTLTEDRWVPITPGAVDKVPVIPPLAHVEGGYAWSVCNRNMEPRYFIGEVVYLHPGLMPREGDFVLARSKIGLVTVARLLKMGAEITLGYMNGGICETVALADLDFIHRIVGSAG